jgi:hypothetical protein
MMCGLPEPGCIILANSRAKAGSVKVPGTVRRRDLGKGAAAAIVLTALRPYAGALAAAGSTASQVTVGLPGQSGSLFRLPGSVQRLSQVTGRVDPQGWGMLNDTDHDGVPGVDLGVPVEHAGKLWFLFGDVPHEGYPDDNADPLASTMDTSPQPGGPRLSFVDASPGRFQPLSVRGLPRLGTNDTPTGGFSYRGRLFVFVVLSDKKQRSVRSFLASTGDPASGQKFLLHYQVSDSLFQGRFFQISAMVIDNADWPGLSLPRTTGEGLLLWGQGLDRGVYHAWMPLDGIPAVTENAQVAPAMPLYYLTEGGWARRSAGSNAADPGESAAVPLCRMPSINQLQVTWLPEFGQWMMLYGTADGTPSAGFRKRLPVVYRTATDPRGPWSEEALLLDPADGGYGRYMVDPDDTDGPLNDLPLTRGRGGGWCYGAFLIPRYTNAAGQTGSVYFIISVNAPYQVMFFKALLAPGDTWRGWMRVICAADLPFTDPGNYATFFQGTAPASVAPDATLEHLFVMGNDERIWHTMRTPSAPQGDWQSWLPVTDNPADPNVSTFNRSTPPVAITRGTDIDLFAIGNDSRIWHRLLSAGPWQPVTDNPADPNVSTFNRSTPPVAITRGTDIDLFAIGNDSRIWRTYWHPAGYGGSPASS